MNTRFTLFWIVLGLLPVQAVAVEPTKADLIKNDAQYTCMKFIGDKLDDEPPAKFEFFEHFPVKILADGSYNVLVSYTQPDKHVVSCTIKKAGDGWTPVEIKEVKQ